LFNTATDGLILSIKMTPPGFRDVNLKSFVNKMRKAGYDLYDNPSAPGWHWTWNSSAEGYQLEDSEALSNDVEELPQLPCDVSLSKNGTETDCPPTDVMVINQPLGPDHTPFTGTDNDINPAYSITPNPVTSNSVTITVYQSNLETIFWKIVDAYGHVRFSGRFSSDRTENKVTADVNKLESFMYIFVTDRLGTIGRFIKM
jgi:hypothetical protein